MIYIKRLILLAALIGLQAHLNTNTKTYFVKNSQASANRHPAEDTTHFRVNQLLTEESLETASDLATKLLKICAPPKCKIVGLGSSPSLLIAYLKAINPESSISLPISDFRHSPRQTKNLLNNAEDTALGDKTKSLLFDYFENFLLPQLGSSTQQIMLVDFTNTGRSLFAIQSYLELFINDRTKKTIDITSAALLDPYNKKDIQRVGKKYFNISDAQLVELDPDGHFFINMVMSQYDHYNEYGPYRITPKIHRGKVKQKSDLETGLPMKNTSLKRKLFVERITAFAHKKQSNACNASLQ